MMKYVFILAFLGASAYASIQTSGLGFDYSAATPEARLEFMQKQGDLMERRMKKALNAHYGYSTAITVKSVTAKTGSLSAILNLDYSDKLSSYHKTREKLTELFCPEYVKMPISDHNLKVLVDMQDINGRRAGRFMLTQQDCAEFLPDSMRD
jgi:hypothetical protein